VLPGHAIKLTDVGGLGIRTTTCPVWSTAVGVITVAVLIAVPVYNVLTVVYCRGSSTNTVPACPGAVGSAVDVAVKDPA
jgi:hypothetical protein